MNKRQLKAFQHSCYQQFRRMEAEESSNRAVKAIVEDAFNMNPLRAKIIRSLALILETLPEQKDMVIKELRGLADEMDE